MAVAPGLKKNELSFNELVANNLANVAPAIASFFVFGSVVAGAGVGAPLIILIAGIAVLFHVNTTTEFARVSPSAGFYATYISRGLGTKVGAWLATAYVFGLILTYVAVTYQMGVWVAAAFQALFGVGFPWWVAAIVLQGLVLWLTLIGVKISVRTAITLFGFELLILIVSAIFILATNPTFISLAGFAPHNVQSGMTGLGAAFPLALFLFLGTAAGSSPLAEESLKPSRNLPKAIFTAAIAAIILYVVMSWVEVIWFNNKVCSLLKASFPFITATTNSVPALAPFLYLAGFTSALAVLLSVVNGLGRLIYSVAREGLLPRSLAEIHPKWQTPSKALIYSSVLTAVITLVMGFWAGADNGFGYSATLGTDVAVVIWIAANVALPIYFTRHPELRRSVWRHYVFPIVGIAILIYPLWVSVSPAQPYPYNLFGVFLLIVLIGSAIYAATRWSRSGMTLGSNIVAGEEGQR